jgi:hypothetical protein
VCQPFNTDKRGSHILWDLSRTAAQPDVFSKGS